MQAYNAFGAIFSLMLFCEGGHVYSGIEIPGQASGLCELAVCLTDLNIT